MSDNPTAFDNTESSAGSAQQRKAAHQLRAVADQLRDMAARGGQYGPAAQQAAERLNSAASWLEQREPADMIREASQLARRRPGTVLAGTAVAALAVRRHPVMVLAGAAAAGVAASRLVRGAATTRPAGQPGPGAGRPDQPGAAIPAPPDPAWTSMPGHPEVPSAPTADSAPYYPASGVPGPGTAGPAGPEPHGPEPHESGEQA